MNFEGIMRNTQFIRSQNGKFVMQLSEKLKIEIFAKTDDKGGQ